MNRGHAYVLTYIKFYFCWGFKSPIKRMFEMALAFVIATNCCLCCVCILAKALSDLLSRDFKCINCNHFRTIPSFEAFQISLFPDALYRP